MTEEQLMDMIRLFYKDYNSVDISLTNNDYAVTARKKSLTFGSFDGYMPLGTNVKDPFEGDENT